MASLKYNDPGFGRDFFVGYMLRMRGSIPAPEEGYQ